MSCFMKSKGHIGHLGQKEQVLRATPPPPQPGEVMACAPPPPGAEEDDGDGEGEGLQPGGDLVQPARRHVPPDPSRGAGGSAAQHRAGQLAPQLEAARGPPDLEELRR